MNVITDDADRIGEWVCTRAGGTWVKGRGTAVGLEKHGRLIAGVIFEDYNGANINIHVASDGSKNWLNREFLWFSFYYPFVQLKVKRVTALVASTNDACNRFVKNLGFELEATLKDAHPSGDILVHRITPDKCRWHKLKD